MISTKDLSGLPNAERLKAFCKGLAALDVIMLKEEWSFIRHYTYNPAWRKGKEAFFATDGGDQIGLRAVYHGVEWATNREEISDVVDMLVQEVDDQLAALA